MTVFVKSLLYLLIISDINIDKVINYKTAVTAISFSIAATAVIFTCIKLSA